jgi:hypothetical protein
MGESLAHDSAEGASARMTVVEVHPASAKIALAAKNRALTISPH